MDLRDGQDKSGKLYQSGLEALVSQGTALIVPKEKIAANGDYNLSGERYREGVATTSAWPFVEIGDLCEVKGGKRLPQGEPFAIEKTAHPYLRVSDFRNATVDTSNLKYITEEIHNTISRYTISSVDVYITIAGTIGLMGTIPEYLEGANLTENAAKLVIVTERIDKRYLALIGNGILVQEQIASLTHAVGVPKLSLERIKTIRIPLPPLDVQKEIVAEIEDYQKVINGARAVLDNYRPHIHIHPDWPTVKLGAVISLEYGKPLKAEDRAEGDFPVFGSNGIVGYHNEFLVEAPAIIVGRKGSAGAVNFSKQPCYPIDTTFYVQIKHIHKLDLHFCYYQLCALELDKVNTQSGVPGLNRNDAYEKAFNLPPLATQQAIVAEIEAEQALVAANRELITRFEKKIQATLARVWGEELEHGCTD
ncbi:MAG: restriction endonuclease subunit S, partial [Methylobacter sp.]